MIINCQLCDLRAELYHILSYVGSGGMRQILATAHVCIWLHHCIIRNWCRGNSMHCPYQFMR